MGTAWFSLLSIFNLAKSLQGGRLDDKKKLNNQALETSFSRDIFSKNVSIFTLDFYYSTIFRVAIKIYKKKTRRDFFALPSSAIFLHSFSTWYTFLPILL